MELKGFVHFNAAEDKFDVVAWLEDGGAIQTVGLSDLQAQLYDKDGVSLSYSVTDLSPEAIGIYNFVVVDNPSFIESGGTYLLRLETQFGGNEVSTFLPFTITNIC